MCLGAEAAQTHPLSDWGGIFIQYYQFIYIFKTFHASQGDKIEK